MTYSAEIKSNTASIKKDFSVNKKTVLLALILTPLIVIIVMLGYKYFSKIPDNQISETENNQVIIFSSWENIPTLQFGHYAIWLIDKENNYYLIKRFNSIPNQLNGLDGQKLTSIEFEAIETITKVQVTIEIEGDRDEVPSNIVFLEATPSYNENFSLILNSNLPDFSALQLFYTLESPTDQDTTINELSGIWFKNSSLQKITSLSNSQWIYQARLEYKSIYDLNIGQFKDLKTSDNFSKYSAQIVEQPKYPGEDFLKDLGNNLEGPINLTNRESIVIVSLEPFADESDPTGESIFIPIFKSQINSDATSKIEYSLDNIFKEPFIEIFLSKN